MEKNRLAAILTYRRVCKFAILIHILAMTVLYKNNTYIFSILIQLHESEVLAYKSCRNRIHKRLTPGKSSRVNACFIFNSILCFAIVVFATWLDILLSNCGDIHPNPGP